MKNAAACVFVLAALCLGGCATSGAVKGGNVAVTKAAINQAPEMVAGAVVVRAKRLTKLESLKKEAVRKNNKQTFEIAAGTAAAVAAFVGTDIYFKAKNEKPNQLASLGITAAAAYACSALAGIIYEMLDNKDK
jgi:hypothetical protein